MKEEEIPTELRKLVIKNSYEYIRYKASRFIKEGPKKYRRADALGMPEETLSPVEIAMLEEGCRQVIGYKGLTKEAPFELLGVASFYQMMELFHFTIVNRKTEHPAPSEYLDEMHMQHLVTGKEMILYNLVKYSI